MSQRSKSREDESNIKVAGDKTCRDKLTHFISQTYDLLEANNPKASYRKVLSWSDKGDTFIIHNIEKFKVILPRYFKTTNYTSFLRQLNLYGFKKIKSDMPVHEFYHPSFRKNNINNLYKIVRRPQHKAKNRRKILKTSNITTEAYVALLSRVESSEIKIKKLVEQNTIFLASLSGLRKKMKRLILDDSSKKILAINIESEDKHCSNQLEKYNKSNHPNVGIQTEENINGQDKHSNSNEDKVLLKNSSEIEIYPQTCKSMLKANGIYNDGCKYLDGILRGRTSNNLDGVADSIKITFENVANDINLTTTLQPHDIHKSDEVSKNTIEEYGSHLCCKFDHASDLEYQYDVDFDFL